MLNKEIRKKRGKLRGKKAKREHRWERGRKGGGQREAED